MAIGWMLASPRRPIMFIDICIFVSADDIVGQTDAVVKMECEGPSIKFMETVA